MKLTFNDGRRHSGVCVVSIRSVGLAAMSALERVMRGTVKLLLFLVRLPAPAP